METTNHVLDSVLKDLSVPHIEERLSRDFFYQLGLRFPQQYGIACRDVAACVRRAEALGAGPARVSAPRVSSGSWLTGGASVSVPPLRR